MEELKKEQIILPSDGEAASIKTITGWVSRKGHFFGDDERSARYDGSTHLKCPTCGKIINKHEYCYECHTKAEIEKYQKMKRKKWNGIDGIYSYAKDKWFWSYEELDDYIMDNNTTVDDLLLILGQPVYAREIDPFDYYEEDFPDENKNLTEDFLPEDLLSAFDDLNVYIRNSKVILSWKPSKFAAKVR